MARQKNIVGSLNHVTSARIGDDIHIHLPGPGFPKELTLQVPRTHDESLIGRDEELAELYISLHAQKRVVVVNGLGGIGKTTLAQAYIYRYYNEYHHIAWITQDTDDIAKDFAGAPGLARNLHIEALGAETDYLFSEIIRQMKSITGYPNLLVIDNGERTLARYRDMLPAQPHWHVLVTSRESITGFSPQPLGFLSEAQSVALFRKHYPLRNIRDEGIRRLVKAVEYHTLTIEILARMAARQRYGLPMLLQAIEKDLRANVEVPHSRRTGTIDRIGSYIRTTFKMSGLGGEEMWVLQQMACLPPEFQTYRLLRELCVDEKGPHADAFAETLTELTERGLLLYSPATDSYRMHRIIAVVVRKEQPVRLEDIAWLLTTLTEKVRTEFSTDNTLDKFGWVPYGKALLAVFPRDMSPAIAELQNQLSFVLFSLCDYDGARALLEKAIRSGEKHFGSDHPVTTMSYNNLALIHMELGEYEAARVLLEKALRDDERNLGPIHHHTVIRLGNLAHVLEYQGDYAGAKVLAERAIRAATKNLGAGHPSTVRAYGLLAGILTHFDEYEKARSIMRKAVRADEKFYGVDHPAVMSTYAELAFVLNGLGQHAEARRLKEKVVRSREKLFGPDHPKTAQSYKGLAMVLNNLEEYGAARALMGKAIRIYDRHYGPDNHTSIAYHSCLAWILECMGELAEAGALLKKCAGQYEKVLGKDHPDTLDEYSELGRMLYDADQYRSAKSWQTKAVRGCEKRYGKDAVDTANAYYELALTLIMLDECKKAADLLSKAQDVYKKHLPRTAEDLKDTAKFLRRLRGRLR
ncbi:MAG TPA: tetratricopeptide repeat protein [Puia sp.]|nr:tetratricopeptide repeat protein [Puia sp.]